MNVINSSRTKDRFFGSCLRELWLEVARWGFELRAIHLPGVENRVADWLSRWDVHPSYGASFKDFMGDKAGEYKELVVTPEMFAFSGQL